MAPGALGLVFSIGEGGFRMSDYRRLRLKAAELRKSCDPEMFDFASTAELKAVPGVFGQERAKEALEFGLNMKSEGYNIFVCGPSGIGRHSMVQQTLKSIARKRPVPRDWLYVCNFQDLQKPLAISFPAGRGSRFQKGLEKTVETALEQVEQALHGEDLVRHRSEELKALFEEANKRLAKMEKEARKQGFTIVRQAESFTPVPLQDGEAISQEQFLALPEKERGVIMQKTVALQDRVNEALRQYQRLEYQVRQKLQVMETDATVQVVTEVFTPFIQLYSDQERVSDYLKALQADLAEHASMLLTQNSDNDGSRWFHQMDKRNIMRRYQVNLLVDNQGQKHAPVVYESKADYNTLFGQIDHEGEFGILSTDFTHIRGGALHRANGGYLILDVQDVLNSYYIWQELKQVLRHQRLKVENLASVIGLLNSASLDVESIPVDLKVILIGDYWSYYVLNEVDSDFRRLFRVRVDFDTEMKRDRRQMKNYAGFIASVCEQEQLRHFTPGAVARVVESGSRLAEDRNKLSSWFDRLKEIICESDAAAGKRKAELVAEEDVVAALRARRRRASRLEDRIFENMRQQVLLIDTDGDRIGELNGLAVYNMGDYAFARPMRITAKTYVGSKGLVNIERETHMSGSIHSKGILTLSGYLGGQYAKEQPLSLSASVTFEQSYGEIEGDSASSAELCALLSSLGQFKIYQGIAVTGSVNQNGEIQPIGGVNEKIEAFFKLCQQRRLNGRQGVIIPKQNVQDLMLDEEIVAAVNAEQFSVWAVGHINEAISILSGLELGIMEMSGRFTPDSIHDLVDQRLREFNSLRSGRTADQEELFSARILRRRNRRSK